MAVTNFQLVLFGMADIEEYFDYILDSKTNGQHKQAKELYNELSPDDGMQSKGQRSEFWEYVETLYHYDIQDNADGDTESEIDNLKNYFGWRR